MSTYFTMGKQYGLYHQILDSLDYTTEDLVLKYAYLLDEGINDSYQAHIYLSNIVKCHKRIDTLRSSSVDELVRREMEEQREFLIRAEQCVTPEDNLYREKVKTKIAELENWEPVSESSKYVKQKLIEKIKKDERDLFAFVYGITEPETDKQIKMRIEQELAGCTFVLRQRINHYMDSLKKQEHLNEIKIEIQKISNLIQ